MARKSIQLLLDFASWKEGSKETIIYSIKKLKIMYENGILGGDIMPEDANPKLELSSAQNYHYFTLPMALNYQRDSYSLWKAALLTYRDIKTRSVFDPFEVIKMPDQKLRDLLIKYKLGLQPKKHTDIWKTISVTICDKFNGNIKDLFKHHDWHIPDILYYIQKTNKTGFPYLSGPKISNYWLYVMDQYTDAKLTGRADLTIAPDTHVIQASIYLGLVKPEVVNDANIRHIVSKAWNDVLDGTGILPIDIHTPLWLWSRSGFIEIKD